MRCESHINSFYLVTAKAEPGSILFYKCHKLPFSQITTQIYSYTDNEMRFTHTNSHNKKDENKIIKPIICHSSKELPPIMGHTMVN